MNAEYTKLEYLSLEESTEKDIVLLVQKYGRFGWNLDEIKEDKLNELNEKKFKLHYIPIVDNHKNRNLLFMVKTSEL